VRTLPLLLAAAAAGFLGGWLAAGGGGEAGAARHATRAASIAPPERERGAAAGEGGSTLAKALASIAPPEPGRGHGRIDGCVRTKQGGSRGGAVIRAERNEDDEDGGEVDDTLEGRVRTLVRSEQRRLADTFEVLSDREGRFAFTGLAEGAYLLTATLKGHRLAVDGEESVEASPGDTVDFVAEEVAEVEVSVLLPDGTPAGAFRVEAMSEESGAVESEWHEGARTTLRLPAGAHHLVATGRDAGPDPTFRFGSDPERIEAVIGGPPLQVTLRLLPKRRLFGRVRVAVGEPTGLLRIHALRLGGGEEPDLRRLLDTGETEYAYGSADGYAFEFDEDEVSEGRVLLGAALSGTVLAWRVIDVAGATQCDFGIERLPTEQLLAVTVLGPDGAPLEDVSVWAGAEDGDGDSCADGNSAIRVGDGSFLVAHYPDDGAVRRFVGVSHEALGSKRVHYRRDTDRSLTIRFGPAARLLVSMRGLSGSDLRGLLSVALVPPEFQDLEIAGLASDATIFAGNDRLELGPAESGSYRLVVFLLQDKERFEVARHEVRLGPGENKLNLPLPALHRLTVRAPGLAAGRKLELRRAESRDWRRRARHLGGDGVATFTLLPPGRYLLTEEDVFSPAMTVEVPHTGEVLFAPSFNAMAVVISDPEGGLARAGLADGDLVVGIDGAEFADATEMRLLVAKAARSTAPVTLLVERNGRRLEIRLPQPALLGAGGAFEPASR